MNEQLRTVLDEIANGKEPREVALCEQCHNVVVEGMEHQCPPVRQCVCGTMYQLPPQHTKCFACTLLDLGANKMPHKATLRAALLAKEIQEENWML